MLFSNCWNKRLQCYHPGSKPFSSTSKNDLRTYHNIQKIETGQGDDYRTGCLLDYSYFKNYYKMITMNLKKQQALEADPNAIQQLNFTGNLARDEDVNTTMFFHYWRRKKKKETILDFSNGTVKVLYIYLDLK